MVSVDKGYSLTFESIDSQSDSSMATSDVISAARHQVFFSP